MLDEIKLSHDYSKSFLGFVDEVEGLIVSGWVQASPASNEPVSVQIKCDGSVCAETIAAEYRADLASAGVGDGNHAFAIAFPSHLLDGHEHVITLSVKGSDFDFGGFRYIIPAGVVGVASEHTDWSGEITSILGLVVEGYFYDRSAPDRVFQIEAVVDGKVVAAGQTGWLPREYVVGAAKGDRCGFRLTLPHGMLDGQKHQVSLLFDGVAGHLRDFAVDGAQVGTGVVDSVEPRSIKGWAFSFVNATSPAIVEVLLGDRIIGRGTANKFRADIADTFHLSGFQGFEIVTERTLTRADLPMLGVKLAAGGALLPISDAIERSRNSLADIDSGLPVEANLDKLDKYGVAGWAFDPALPNKRIRVNLLIGGVCVGGVLADASRPDVGRAYNTDGSHGFHIGIPPGLGLRGVVNVKVVTEAGEIIGERDYDSNAGTRRLDHPVSQGVGPRSLAKDLYRPKIVSRFEIEPSVCIILINRNGANHLEAFLQSFATFNTYSKYQIVIVDHASTDASAEVVSRWNERLNVRFVRRSRNYSFSASNNFAVEGCDDQVILFVNNDIILTQCIVAPMLRYLSDRDIGIVGIKLRTPPEADSPSLAAREGYVQHLGIKFGATSSSNPIGAYELPLHPDASSVANSPWLVPAVTAATMMMWRDDFLAVGGFDESYFYSYEDVDLCLKVGTSLGKRIVCANDVLAYHHRGATRSNADAGTRSTYARNLEHLQRRFGAYLRQKTRKEALRGERFLRLEPLRVAFLVSTTDFAAPEADFFTAYELGEALAELHGWQITYIPPEDWYDLDGVDVAVAMRHDWDARKVTFNNPNLLRIAWARNWFESWLTLPWLEEFDIVWTASNKSVDAFRQITSKHVELVRIATSEKRFSEAVEDEEFRTDYCFTGSFFKAPRDILSVLQPRALRYQFGLFGHNWNDISWLKPYWRGPLPYPEVPKVYASTKLVVDDCNHTVKNWGSVNSRVFDALAAGALVVSNGQLGSDEVFDGLLPTYKTREDLTSSLAHFLSNEGARCELVSKLRSIVLSEHTYRHRAHQIGVSLDKLFGGLRFAIHSDSSLSVASELMSRELRKNGNVARLIPSNSELNAAERFGDDVAIYVTCGYGALPELRADQVNIRLHLGPIDNTSLGQQNRFDIVINTDPSETHDEGLVLFDKIQNRENCFTIAADGAVIFKDAGRLRAALNKRFDELTKLVDDANETKLSLQDNLPGRHAGRAASDLVAEKLDIVIYPDYRTTNPYQRLLYQGFPPYSTIHSGDIDYALAMQRRPDRSNPIVFHLHWTSPIIGLEQAPIVARRRVDVFLQKLRSFVADGGQLVWTIHNILPHEAPFPDLEVELCREIVSSATTIHVHSKIVPSLVADYYELPEAKVVIGHHGNYVGVYPDTIDRNEARLRLGIDSDEFVFLFLGQMRAYKGLERLISVFSDLRTPERLRLLLVGNPVNMPLEKLKEAVAVDGRIQIISGHVPDEDLQIYLRAADFMVLPYDKVLTSGTVYLSLSMGLPVIAPRSGLIPDVIRDGQEGFLFEGGIDSSLRDSLEKALSLPRNQMEAFRCKASERAGDFDWNHTGQVLGSAMLAATKGKPTLIDVEGKYHKVFVREVDHLPAKQARVAAVVLHYSHLDDTIRCVDSLLSQEIDCCHVYIVSNDLDAQAFASLCREFPECTVIQSDDNLGYAGGNNLGLRLIQEQDFEYVWIVNPDTVLPDGFLARILEIADTNENTAIFGSKILFGDRPDLIWFGGGVIDWEDGIEAKHLYIGKAKASMPNTPFSCDYVTGASLFFRKSLLNDVGFLPEHYFLYFEETHWCLTAAERGHAITMFPETHLYHHKRSEDGGAPTPTFLYYYCRNALLMCREFRAEAIRATESRLRRTAAIWLDRVSEANPDLVELSHFAIEKGIEHGHEGRRGRFDFVAAFNREIGHVTNVLQ